VQDALYAVTLDAVYLLKMDHEIGSIEVGKRADFSILEEDPPGHITRNAQGCASMGHCTWGSGPSSVKAQMSKMN
jgi:imidazolonepropionase-like amidohydrolase